MRRSLIAATWILGATVPLLAAFVLLFGCCVLPFHGVIHKVVPLCHLAAGLLHHHEQQTPLPAREKQQPAKRIAGEAPSTFQPAAASSAHERFVARGATTYRSFISHGALRCDQDVGLHLLIETLLI